MPVALILFSLGAARAQSYFAAARIGIAFGIGIFGVITIASRDWALIVPVALTLIGTSVYALPQALWAHHVGRRRYGIADFCATIAAWSLVMELCDVLGFPTKGEGLAAIAGAPVLMGGARLLGSNVVCGIMIAGTIGCGVRLAGSSPLRARLASALRPVVVSLLLLLALSGLAHLSAPAAVGTRSVGIPQMNVPSAYFTHRLSHPELVDAFEDAFAKQVRDLSGVDLLALTETYDGAYPLLLPRVRQRFENYARLQGQGVLLTSYLASADGGMYNAVGGINPQGQLVGVHRKVDLAPFGEVEFEHGSTFQPQPILPGVRVGVLICQESLLPDGPSALARAGANVLVSHTSDISFGSGLLSFEHLALARMRAIETGRAMVWASAAGPSGAVDRWGGFNAGGPFRLPAPVRVKVDLYDDLSPYLRAGWLWRLLATGGLLAHLALRRARPTAHRKPRQPAVGTLRGFTELALALVFAWGVSVGSAAAVEVVNGTPGRAKNSALQLLHHYTLDLGPGSLARFKADGAHSASAAVAYLLESYGQRTLPSAVNIATQDPTLADLIPELERGHGLRTREIAVDFQAMPRVEAIVQSKDGEFCVTTSNRAHQVWLFQPSLDAVRELTPNDASRLLKPTALVPADDDALRFESDKAARSAMH